MFDPKPITHSLARIERWLEIMPSSDYIRASEVVGSVVGKAVDGMWSIDRLTAEEMLISVHETTTLILFRMRRIQIQRSLVQIGISVDVKLRLKA